jgi:alkanesulfonate monooxygenase SsuD/methylene tetrahydromethanopterin reductase-like flavin-dependent oxidoreductase (luciferase family)
MNYGVVLPIWQLTVAEAESLATRAEALGLDGVFVPDHIGRIRSPSSRISPVARDGSAWGPA